MNKKHGNSFNAINNLYIAIEVIAIEVIVASIL